MAVGLLMLTQMMDVLSNHTFYRYYEVVLGGYSQNAITFLASFADFLTPSIVGKTMNPFKSSLLQYHCMGGAGMFCLG